MRYKSILLGLTPLSWNNYGWMVISESIWRMTLFLSHLYPYVHWGMRINAETLDWDEDHPIGDITKIDAKTILSRNI